MVHKTKERLIIQAPSGTRLSVIKPRLPKTATLRPLKHRMLFGERTFRYLVPNDGFEYFLFKRNSGTGILPRTLQKLLENEEWVVRDVLDFGEKEIFHQSDKKLKKELEENDQKVVRDTFDLKEEEEIFHKKLKQELQEKDEEITALTNKIKDISQENETLHKILLQNLEKEVHKAVKEYLKKFEEEFGTKREDQEENLQNTLTRNSTD